jgi:hypothetical protein
VAPIADQRRRGLRADGGELERRQTTAINAFGGQIVWVMNPWGANTRSRGNLVLVDESPEEIAPPNVRHDANLRDRRSSLGSQELKPSMRPLPVVVLHVGPQNPLQVPGAKDQLPVQTVGAQRLHPAL